MWWTVASFVVLILFALDAYSLSSPNAKVAFRPASAADVSFAQKTMLQQAMNPLSISKSTLLVAYDEETQDLVGFGQIRPLSPEYSELASLFVLPERRKQGIGSSLVDALLDKSDAENDDSIVCLLTLRPTVPFYESHGFHLVESLANMPAPLQFEFMAGTLISALLGNDLVCMVR